ncbi:uncharacterized protein L969DRAFT_43985 [Mixia osmundae IAM 14324]|uniref:Protein N-terminal glutamine amidohydrolase n=1 Tax=Mixia osmundae (strain CBS 9802 / IAM 14324 / JCM 22182 / KY 12970) TaxID=764103 RepID=G7E020_MIXOS|nr:uncharacterized protein L969DRAFT_43985 [Mixia osmundae IAM 14324]KEI42173.1 hypothetical protein L969DRAFT_43985 [Mixia osmundae IAM 14324]GAA96180.1 hypothetical protein E5Q_02844 [Mixia osmundae IAM 14324]
MTQTLPISLSSDTEARASGQISAAYTPFYCEENVYKLLEAILNADESRAVYAIFISNQTRSVLLREQRASSSTSDDRHSVIWDYHVIVLDVTNSFVVYDRDSLLTAETYSPVDAQHYFEHTFEAHYGPRQYEPTFRLFDGTQLLKRFQSNRSHMLVDLNAPEKGYWQTPPSYACIGPEEPIADALDLWRDCLDISQQRDIDGSVVLTLQMIVEGLFA